MELAKIRKKESGEFLIKFSGEFVKILSEIRVNRTASERYLIPMRLYESCSYRSILARFFNFSVFDKKEVLINCNSISPIETTISDILRYWKNSVIQEDISIKIKPKRKVIKGVEI